MKKKEDLALISEKDISLVENSTLNANQIQQLLKRTPSHYIRNRPGKGGQTWYYVSVGYFKKVLNLMFGFNWDFEIVDEKIIGDCVIVKGKLTCRVNDHTIVKMQFGSKEIMYKNDYIKQPDGTKKKVKTETPLDLGNDFKAAASDALKKCASDIGIAADIYNKEEFREIKIKEAQKDYKNAIQ